MLRRGLATSAVGRRVAARIEGDRLIIDRQGKSPLAVPSVWVRDNDWSTASRSTTSGQKLHTPWELSPSYGLQGVSIVPASSEPRLQFGGAVLADEEVVKVGLRGAEDALLPESWLGAFGDFGEGDRRHTRIESDVSLPLRTEHVPVRTWEGADWAGRVPWMQWENVRGSEAGLADFLGHFRAYGIGLLRGVPTTPGTILDVLRDIGGFLKAAIPFDPIQEVRVEKAVWNFTFNASRLDPHTDNPYRSPCPPSVQMLHCLRPATTGGESTLTDGFFVADQLRTEDPEAFRALSTYETVHSFRKPGSCALVARGKVIEVDGTNGRVSAIRFNARTLEAFDAPPHDLVHMYRGYRRFGELANRVSLRFTMQPGDLYVVHNRRAMHGREAFVDGDNTTGPSRWLQTVYADVDALESRHRLAVAAASAARS